MSFKHVRNPHIKKSVVTVASAAPYFCPVSGPAVEVVVVGVAIGMSSCPAFEE
jgi:hypothetical protein